MCTPFIPRGPDPKTGQQSAGYRYKHHMQADGNGAHCPILNSRMFASRDRSLQARLLTCQCKAAEDDISNNKDSPVCDRWLCQVCFQLLQGKVSRLSVS